MATVGSFVWLEDPDVAWIDGEVVEVKGPELKVLCSSGKTVHVKASDVYAKDTEAPPSGVDDMTKLAYLHEPGALQNLWSRYDKNEIYTYIGNTLIAVNPFTEFPHLYDSHMMAQYKGAAFGERSPHPFAVADAAYRIMINEGKIQSILVSGESGAGKTEITKLLMRYLAYMSGRAAAEGRTVEQQVLESHPVLEAFGNARTARNNNSSRFGKFVEIQFDQRGRISGAAVRTYLLERSRVCQISDPDRNYHCFYMLCAAPREDIQRFKLGHPRTFHYLNQSNCFALDGVDDSKEYIATRRAMDIVGISSHEQDAIFRVVAAILHLGNIEFVEGNEFDSSTPKDEKSWFHLKTAAELLMCDTKALEDSLCKHVIVANDETITKFVKPDSAAGQRDALAKIVYSRLFDWIVYKINESIDQDPDSKSLIGVLDIYGFESFETNSFEQLCINLTNEKLQQHFNQHVFKMEQDEYTREEIDWSYIDFVDNQEVLDLIEKKPHGVIALLDQACMFPRSTHETFAQKLYQTFKNHKRFSKPKLSLTDFTICHYAGNVTYQTELFLDKNKNYFKAEHQALLSASQCSFVSGLFPPLAEEFSKQSKFSSIGSRFKHQLVALLETLSVTKPHYIRCVKPNNLLKPAIFESKNVLQQLRCGGVMEAIRISCAGYPTRRPFPEFVDRFGILAPEVLDHSSDEVTICKRLLEKVGLKGYQIGKTKVFLRAGQMAELDARRTEVLGRSASIIQRKMRSYLARRSFVLLQKSTMLIQAVCRGQLARQVYESMRREAACLRIQKYLRTHVARKAYKYLCSTTICIQSGLRGMAARCELRLRKQIKAAIVIQSHCRKYLARVQYLDTKKAAITTQCAWRGRVASRKLQKLKAARETGALQAAKNKLEKQVEELTWNLQLEKRMRADLEESKNQENVKMQSTLKDIRLKFKETKELFLREQEAAKRAAEIDPLIQEIPVIDHAMMEKLTSENAKLKGLVNSLEKKIDDTDKKYETKKIGEERLKQALEVESKMIKMKKDMQRLVEKISDTENENQILWEHVIEENGTNEPPSATPECQQNIDALINCVVKKNIGFSHGKPIAAFTIYKCLLHWKSFEAERTSVFDQLIQAIGSAIESEDSKDHMAYWLSNTSTLLSLLQRSLKAAGSSGSTPHGKMGFHQVEAKYPALLLKQQLKVSVEKTCGKIRDNLKKDLGSLVSLCIQAPRTSPFGVHFDEDLSSIIKCLDTLLRTLKKKLVLPVLIRKIFSLTFSYINAQLFNSLLLRRGCCTWSDGQYLKAGLDKLESWCQGKEEYAGSFWEKLKDIRQAVEFLVCSPKYRISHDKIINLCPLLSVQQLCRICVLYRDDTYDSKSVSPEVISSMSVQLKEDSNSDVRFLLREDSSVPFSVNELPGSLREKDFEGVEPAEELLKNPAFRFLRKKASA